MDKVLKLHGINMTINEWFKLLTPDIYKLAKEEGMKNNLKYPAYRTVNSLAEAINSINWEKSSKGRHFWNTLHTALQKGDISMVDTENIMQILH